MEYYKDSTNGLAEDTFDYDSYLSENITFWMQKIKESDISSCLDLYYEFLLKCEPQKVDIQKDILGAVIKGSLERCEEFKGQTTTIKVFNDISDILNTLEKGVSYNSNIDFTNYENFASDIILEAFNRFVHNMFDSYRLSLENTLFSEVERSKFDLCSKVLLDLYSNTKFSDYVSSALVFELRLFDKVIKFGGGGPNNLSGSHDFVELIRKIQKNIYNNTWNKHEKTIGLRIEEKDVPKVIEAHEEFKDILVLFSNVFNIDESILENNNMSDLSLAGGISSTISSLKTSIAGLRKYLKRKS